MATAPIEEARIVLTDEQEGMLEVAALIISTLLYSRGLSKDGKPPIVLARICILRMLQKIDGMPSKRMKETV